MSRRERVLLPILIVTVDSHKRRWEIHRGRRSCPVQQKIAKLLILLLVANNCYLVHTQFTKYNESILTVVCNYEYFHGSVSLSTVCSLSISLYPPFLCYYLSPDSVSLYLYLCLYALVMCKVSPVVLSLLRLRTRRQFHHMCFQWTWRSHNLPTW